MSKHKTAEALETYWIDSQSLTTVLDWHELFGNDHPIELDVGCGKGLYVANAAQARPDHNFLGIEIAYKFARRTADRVAKLGLVNTRALCMPVLEVLERFVATDSVHAIHLYFPDPWWKKRHKKRRVFNDAFVDQVFRVLEPGGHFWVATDVREYYDMIIHSMESRTTTFTAMPPPRPVDPAHDLDYLTNFERKFRQEGRPIYRAHYRTIEIPPL